MHPRYHKSLLPIGPMHSNEGVARHLRAWGEIFARFQEMTLPVPRGGEQAELLFPARFLGPLNAVLGPGRYSVFHWETVELAPNDFVVAPDHVWRSSASNKHHAVRLQIMANARNVGQHDSAVGQTDAGHFAQTRVGLAGRHHLHLHANALHVTHPLEPLRPTWFFSRHLPRPFPVEQPSGDPIAHESRCGGKEWRERRKTEGKREEIFWENFLKKNISSTEKIPTQNTHHLHAHDQTYPQTIPKDCLVNT